MRKVTEEIDALRDHISKIDQVLTIMLNDLFLKERKHEELQEIIGVYDTTLRGLGMTGASHLNKKDLRPEPQKETAL